MADRPDPGALAGVRVLDLTGGLAGPVAGMLLADLGADVVKVHPPGAGPSGAQPGPHMWDRGKRAGVLDPASPADLEALDRLVEGADVVLAGTSGAAMAYDELLGRGHVPGRPGFWIAMPPYLLGETPWAREQESGGLLFAWLGHAWSQSSYDDVPVDCLYPLALYMQGIWAATVAVALLTGRQLGHELAPLAVAGGAHGGQLVSPGGFAAGGDDPHIHRPGGPGGALANYRCYRCSDGQWLFFGAFTTAFIDRGLHAAGARWLLEDPRVGGDPANVRLPGNLVWITRELEQIFATRPQREWLELLEAADVPAAPAADPGDWLNHDQVRAIGLRLQVRNDAGQDVVMPGPLIGLSHTPAAVRCAAATSWPHLAELTGLWSPRPAAATTPAAPRLPLSGLRVLDLGTIIAGPYVTTLLGELGADAIKVERPPQGDEFRIAHGGRGGVGFSVYNRDQRSILLDLASGPDRDVFLQLARTADVVVDNYRAGVLTRLGIGHDQLSAVNPMVTSVSISAFGETGPLGHRPGFDPVIQAMSGIMRAQGGPDQADSPAFLTVPVNDVLAAGLGALGACAALLARSRLGHGQRVSITLCASSCLLQSEHLVQFPGAPPYPAAGRDFAGPGPLDRLYQAADGWIRLSAGRDYEISELHDAGLAAAAGLSSPDGEPAAREEALAAAIGAAVARLRAAEVVRRATAAGIPAARARQVHELTADEQLIRHRLLTVIEQDESGVARVGPGRWLEMPGLRAEPPGEAPQAGEHGDEIRREAGLVRFPADWRREVTAGSEHQEA
ncbi:MAG TPA: CoA transferase [Streptosporangiaceae bacterium]|nr:CoA transferase [Streptosporangiaceae bacterium]